MKIFSYLAVMIGESQSTDDGLEVHMGVNYVGHFLLTRLLLNNLVKGAEDQVCM
jgi:NAD(P)-dependent dehydrogenase (short-subunit alcohol dehydrogenase family)